MTQVKDLSLPLLVFLGILLVLSILSGCSRRVDDEGYLLIQPVGDPLILPYRFVPSSKLYANESDYLIPMYFTGDGRVNACLIGNSWNLPDTQTAVIFYKDIATTRSIEQYNLPAFAITAYLVHDFNRDSADEIALTYRSRDTVWLEIIDHRGTRLYKKFLATGKDLDRNGYWDGWGILCTVYDFDRDGWDEIIAGVDVGYDLYPRRLFCLDWHRDSSLWQYDVSGVICPEYTYVVRPSEMEPPQVVVTVQSKGNAARAGDMDDSHAYLIVLDESGREQWKIETGGAFANSRATIIDYDDDGVPDILTSYRYIDSVSRAGKENLEGSRLLVYSLRGEKLRELDLGPGRVVNIFQHFDFNSDEIDEVCLICSDHCFYIIDENLRFLRKYKSYSGVGEIEYRDFLGDGTRQFLLTSDNKLWLFDSDFKPLAQYGSDDIAKLRIASVFKPEESLPVYSIILTDRARTFNYIMALEPSPWYTIFSRNPILAFLAAFIPLSIIILIIWVIMAKFRQKNIVIRKQRDRLNTALAELKDAQEKLIAAEKYKQARDIAGGFAHEIRNALFPARSSLKQLRSLSRTSRLDNEQVEKYAKNTDRAVARAVDITKLISQYTRLDSEYIPEPVNLSRLVNELIEAYEVSLRDNGIKLEFSGAAETIRVSSNHKQLYLVLNNLMLNSFDSLTNRTNRVIFILIKEDKDFVTLSFQDSGCGISPDNLKRIFDTFYSTKPDKGTGLGLALAKKIVEMYEGSISVSSELDKGTRFDLKLMRFKNSQ